MKLNRRELLAQTGLLAATAKWASAAAPGKAGSSILAKADFPIAESQTYLNCAGWHPTPAATARAMKAYVDFKNTGKIDGKDTDSSTPVPEMFARVTRSKEVKELFAKLVNAKPTEIAYVQSTMAGESVIIEGLGLPRGGGNVVTDALHFEGSLYAYREMEKQGLEVRIASRATGASRFAIWKSWSTKRRGSSPSRSSLSSTATSRILKLSATSPTLTAPMPTPISSRPPAAFRSTCTRRASIAPPADPTNG